MEKLSKKNCKTMAIVCFALAVLCVGISTMRLQQIREANMSNISYGMNFIERSHTESLNSADMIEAALTLQDMKANNAKVTFYTWFRIIGGIIFTAGGVYFAVSAKKKDEGQAEVAEDNSAEN